MRYRSLRRAAALMAVVACSIAFGAIAATAQQDDELDRLNQEVVALYRAGNYAQITGVADAAARCCL
jgi:hypothetical protein